MIEIRRLEKGIDYDDYDEMYMIVRSMKPINPKIQQLDILSPQPSLFKFYRECVNKGTWNQRTFDNSYAPVFITQLQHSPLAKQTLEDLYHKDLAGKRICLMCYCTNEAMCHRSIIAGILQGLGCDVKLKSKVDYSRYYLSFIFGQARSYTM